MPSEFKYWTALRCKKGSSDWVLEHANVNISGYLCQATEAGIRLPFIRKYRMAPDDTLWGLIYNIAGGLDGDKHNPGMRVVFLRSTDNGENWDLLSEIIYDPKKIPYETNLNEPYGFNELDVLFLENERVICIMRSQCTSKTLPLYKAVSTDNGATWSDPVAFDDYGVQPEILNMGKFSLLAYGRPGITLRITDDPIGEVWSEKINMPDFANNNNTCSYTNMVQLDDNTALIVYSNSAYPDKNWCGIIKIDSKNR